MADKITFTGVTLLSFSRTKEGGEARFSASLTQPVIRGMEWADMPECVTGGSLEGELAATNIRLTPKDEALTRHEMDLDVSKVSKFQTIRLELPELPESRGKGHRNELRFAVRYTDIKGSRKLEEYILTCGKSTLTASYMKQAKQESLPGVEIKDAQESLGVQ